jgi:hypothetical protein
VAVSAAGTYRFTAELWRWDGDAGWFFVTVPEEPSDEIEHRTAHRQGGFGSVKVEVTVGATTWSTSLFPDRSREAYVLPVKRQVREREGLAEGGPVAVELRLVDV